MRFGLIWFLILVPAISARAAGPDFNQEIRPILSRNCYKCHGPDDEARKAGMRLDARALAIKETASGSVPIVPGKPEESEVIARINAKDATERMPPQSTNLTLSSKQKDLLRQWIAAGAEYREHWSFVPPKSLPLPAVKLAGWTRNPIDRFVLAKLEAQGLAPSPEADRYTLCAARRWTSPACSRLRPRSMPCWRRPRRMKPASIAMRAIPKRPDGTARIGVTSIACSPRRSTANAGPAAGSTWPATPTPTAIEKDRTRSIWPYRDWVIRAINDDMPFDQFTIEQIAGDMLPDATLDERVATGFHRNTMLNEEGGIDPLEYRFYSVVDRVATTSTTWLGLTMRCAQCHTHKFDPITHREYYQFMALLNNADEPSMDLPTPEITAQREQRRKRIEQLIAELPGKYPTNVSGNLRVPSASSHSQATANKTTSVPANGTRSVPDTLSQAFAKWLDDCAKACRALDDPSPAGSPLGGAALDRAAGRFGLRQRRPNESRYVPLEVPHRSSRRHCHSLGSPARRPPAGARAGPRIL